MAVLKMELMRRLKHKSEYFWMYQTDRKDLLVLTKSHSWVCSWGLSQSLKWWPLLFAYPFEERPFELVRRAFESWGKKRKRATKDTASSDERQNVLILLLLMIIILWKKDCYCCEQILKPTVADKVQKIMMTAYAPLRNIGGSTLLCLDGKRLTIINHNKLCGCCIFWQIIKQV